jgi:hypothetical protein
MKITTLTFDEWTAQGTKLFGDDQFRWEFVCPICGHVQKVEDFRPYKDRGAKPNSAYQECLGRYTGAVGFKPKGQGPCDYAGYGLFCVSPIRVVMPDGAEVHAFAFAEPALAANCQAEEVASP